jgi:2-polyprenyl-6-methoxyphenol hydroxylase-like FAD-dependent oxidoreductase
MELIPERSNFSGRAVLIGDAASAFGPLLGQGANKAIEDAYVLSLLLRQRCDMPALLSRYEELRRARHHRFLELERMSAESLIHETAEALQYFEQEIPKINLVTMFQDMIPLVNAEACEEIAAI